MNNIQANTTATFSGFGILSGTQAATIQNGSSTWTAAFPNFLQVLLGSVQPEAKPADAEAYAIESTNDVEGMESFRRTSSTQSKDPAKTATNDSDSLAGTFMRSMLAVNLVLAPVPQFVPVATGLTVGVTSGWNAVSGTASVSNNAIEMSNSATNVQQATATVPVRNEEMSAPKANVIPVETKPATKMDSTASTVTAAQAQRENQTSTTASPMANARPLRAGQAAAGNIAFELNLTATNKGAETPKTVFSDNTLLAKEQFAQNRERAAAGSDFRRTVSEAYSAVEPAATAAFTVPILNVPAEMKTQDAPKESATLSHPEVTLSEAQPARPQTSAVQEISLRIGPENAPVDVTLRTRSGQVQVAVRTSDTTLASSLREELGTLVKALERSGFDAKSFTPALTNFDGLRASTLPTPSPELGQSSNFGNDNGRGNRNPSRDPRQRQNSRRGTFDILEAAA